MAALAASMTRTSSATIGPSYPRVSLRSATQAGSNVQIVGSLRWDLERHVGGHHGASASVDGGDEGEEVPPQVASEREGRGGVVVGIGLQCADPGEVLHPRAAIGGQAAQVFAGDHAGQEGVVGEVPGAVAEVGAEPDVHVDLAFAHGLRGLLRVIAPAGEGGLRARWHRLPFAFGVLGPPADGVDPLSSRRIEPRRDQERPHGPSGVGSGGIMAYSLFRDLGSRS